MSTDDPPVLCVRRSHLVASVTLPVRGFVADRLLGMSDGPLDLELIPRSRCEPDIEWLQFIPYVVLRHNGGILRCRRSPESGEERLYGNWSVGIGGHVEEVDFRKASLPPGAWPGQRLELACLWAARREVYEETALSLYLPEFRLLGLVNDDTTEVGRVHLGVVYEARVPCLPLPEHYSPDIHAPAFGDPLKVPLDLYEPWSRLVIESGVLGLNL